MPCDKVYNGRATTYHFFSDGSAIDIESILVIMRKIIVKILRARLAHYCKHCCYLFQEVCCQSQIHIIFVKKFLDKNQKLLSEHVAKYDELLTKSRFFKRSGNSFGTYQANELLKSIEDNSYLN